MATEAAELAEEAVTLAMADARAKLLTLMGPVPRAAVDTAAAAEDCTTHDGGRQVRLCVTSSFIWQGVEA